MFNFFRKTNEKSLKEGDNVIYHKDKKTVKSKITIKNGKKNGLCKTYNTSGELISETNYIDNMKDGVKREFFSSGNLKRESNWRNDFQHGLTITYYESGNKFRETELELDEYLSQKEYMPEGFIKFKRNGDKYTFYNQDGGINFIAFLKMKDYKVSDYGDPFWGDHYTDFVQPFGTWDIYENGMKTHQYIFDENLESNKLNISKGSLNTFEEFEFNLESLVMFDSEFITNRYYCNESVTVINYANSGFKGPPGASRHKSVDLKFIDIDDVIRIKDRAVPKSNSKTFDNIDKLLRNEGGNAYFYLKNLQKLMEFGRLKDIEKLKQIILNDNNRYLFILNLDERISSAAKIVLILNDFFKKSKKETFNGKEKLEEYHLLSMMYFKVLNDIKQ